MGDDIARAMRIARSGRPGPVHLSLPTDALDAVIEDGERAIAHVAAFASPPAPMQEAAARELLGTLGKASRPLVIAGPQLADRKGRELLARFERSSGVPAFVMESPRGVNDPSLGLLAEVLPKADFVFLLGKSADFTLRFGAVFEAACRVVPLAPDAEARPTLERLAAIAESRAARAGAWREEVRAALDYRPAAWNTLASASRGPVHPVELGGAVQTLLAQDADAVLVSDGGEIGQWMQACVNAPHRVINGVAGAIGAALPCGIAAKLALPNSTVVAMMGDGTFGFHMAELDTAVRCGVPFVAVVGNDAAWNAEHQIQLRSYGKERAHGCELLPARYDRVAEALGGHGEFVERAEQLAGALERAVRSRKPACVNVMIERLPAPIYRR
jgi:acetolactate synthase-1/2/3 large subunit